MFCENCGSRINDDDLFCANCGQKIEAAKPAASEQTQNVQQVPYAPLQHQQEAVPEQQPPYVPPQYPYGQAVYAQPGTAAKKKKKTAIIIAIAAGSVLLIALIIFLVLHFLGGGEEDKDSVDETTRRPTETTEAADVPRLGLGETGVFEGLAMTIDKVARPDAEFLNGKPEEGNEHILVWYTFENISNEPIRKPAKHQLFIVTGENSSSDSGYDMTPYDAQAEYFANDGEYEPAGELAPGEKTGGWLLYQKPKAVPNITIHYYSKFVNKPPDLAFNFPVELAEIEDTEITSATTETPETEQTSEETTAPDDINLTAMLPGVWASLPTDEGYSFVYGFTEDGRVGNSFAYGESGDGALDNWNDPDAWTMDPYTWSNWRLEGGDLIISDVLGDFRIAVTVVSNDEIQLIYEGDEPLSLYRQEGPPTLVEYMVGTWVPDEPDAEGVYAALSFYMDDTAALTGARKIDESATPEQWGYEDYWEVLGEANGTWRLEEGNLIINMQGSEDFYTVRINSANNCTIYYGDSWETTYTRVSYSY